MCVYVCMYVTPTRVEIYVRIGSIYSFYDVLNDNSISLGVLLSRYPGGRGPL